MPITDELTKEIEDAAQASADRQAAQQIAGSGGEENRDV